ncbi:Golgi transport complex subunit 4 [Coemansia sp. RSA 2320]|nr:Golgi transport complex subunit 4 [Coemansia sp. RSA 2320]
MSADANDAHSLPGTPEIEDVLAHSTKIDDFLDAYRRLELEEARLDLEISDCVEASAETDRQFARLFDLRHSVHQVCDVLHPAQTAIDATAANAGAITGRLRFLDQEQASLKHALAMIENTALLRLRLAELIAAMQDKNIDFAAALIHKYITSDAHVLDSPLAAFATSPPGAAELSPRAVVASATAELVDRVSFMFSAAVECNNTREISRCFRLFPLLGEELRGLDMYSDFLCSIIADKSRVPGDIQGSIYAVRLTRLFEVIALVIDNHFPLVESHYGPGRMIRVIQRLQIEGAKRAGMILDFFEDERHIKRRMAQAQLSDKSKLPEDLVPDHDFKDITDILGELVLLERQIATFSRFLESRATPEVKALLDESVECKNRVFLSPAAILKHMPLAMQNDHAKLDDRTGLVVNTPLSLRLAWLTDTYIAFESFFVSRSATKVVLLDDTDALPGWAEAMPDASELDSAKSKPTSSAQRAWHKPAISTRVLSDTVHTSSCVADMFFVLRTALDHAIATQQPSAVEAVSQCANTVLSSSLLASIEPRALVKWNYTTNASSKGLQAPVSTQQQQQQQQQPPKEQISAVAAHQRQILVSLNNLDLASQYLQTTANELAARVAAEWDRIPQRDHIARAQRALETFGAFLAKFTHSKLRAIEQLGAQVVKPWVRAILQQSYRDIKYVLTDEEFNDVQNDNLFQKRFVLKFSHMMRQLKQRLTRANYLAILDIATASLAADWERAIRQSKFNMLGGIMFEKDVREVQRFLELETGALLRKKFLRLVQCADLLAVEGIADVCHIFDAHSAAADIAAQTVLGQNEAKAILANRIDISEKDIADLEL